MIFPLSLILGTTKEISESDLHKKRKRGKGKEKKRRGDNVNERGKKSNGNEKMESSYEKTGSGVQDEEMRREERDKAETDDYENDERGEEGKKRRRIAERDREVGRGTDRGKVGKDGDAAPVSMNEQESRLRKGQEKKLECERVRTRKRGSKGKKTKEKQIERPVREGKRLENGELQKQP